MKQIEHIKAETKSEIQARLKQIEQERNIKILYACESGSRAWGFPSNDSDYDIRFIYTHPLEWYLSLSEKKDTIQFITEEDFDFSAWELKKALNLFKKSNVSVYEWLQSPIVYSDTNNFRAELFELANEYYNPKATYYHYSSMTKKYMEHLNKEGDNTVNLKKLFYILRCFLNVKWICEEQTVHPMEFAKLLTQIENAENGSIVKEINELIEIKKEAGESFVYEIKPFLKNFIFAEFEQYKNFGDSLKNTKSDMNKIDLFFRKQLGFAIDK